MHTIKIIIDQRSIFIVKQYDLLGRQIPDNKANSYEFYSNVFFELDKEKIGTSFQMSISKEYIGSHEPIEFSLFGFKKEIIELLGSKQTINLFSTNHLHYFNQGDTNILPSETEFDFEIDESVYSNIAEQSIKYFKHQSDFNKATKQLLELSDYYPEYLLQYRTKIFNLLHYIHNCIESGDYGNLAGWYSEKYSMIQSSFNEMMSRKNTNNKNYIFYLDSIKRNLPMFHPPNVWEREPIKLIE